MNVKILDPTNKNWLDYVNQNPAATIFHHPAWMNLISDCYGFRAFIFTIVDENSEILSGLPVIEVRSGLTGHRWISLPYTDHCGVLATSKEYSDRLVHELAHVQILESIAKVEVRQEINHNSHGIRTNDYVLHLLKLSSDSNSVFESFKKAQIQRNIRKAEREGVEIVKGQSKNEVDLFYDLHLLTRKRLGVPVQPKLFFELLREHILEPGLGFILIAYINSTPIAGGIFFTYNDTITYKYGASDQIYWKLRANNLLFWEAIKWGCENGCSTFDWGKTGHDNIGLRKFKDGWGAEELPLFYSIIDSGKGVDHSFGVFSEHLVDLMGLVIRKSPTWMCRLTGELFYRYFA